MVREEFIDHILTSIGQCATELNDNFDALLSSVLGETLFPQSEEETELHNELGDIFTDILPQLERISSICDFYEGLKMQFGTYNPA